MATDLTLIPDPPRRTWRGHLGATLVAGSLVVMLALTALAARSYHVEEQVDCGQSTGTFDPRLATASIESHHVKVESGLGVVGIAWERHSWADNQVIPSDHAAIRARQAQLGWSCRPTTTSGKPRPFGRNRQTVGPWQTLHWEDWSGPDWQLSVSGAGTTEHWGIVVPYWLVILPGAGPVVWWFWCPPGRAFPRLTIGRLALATAVLGAALGGLAAFGRSSTSDRALAVFAEVGGNWTYGLDPGGSGRLVVSQVRFAKTSSSRWLTDAEMPRIKVALARCPQLESVAFDPTGVRLTAAGIALIADQLDVPTVNIHGLPVDDATLALLRNHRRVQTLDVGWTKVTDAGLAHLATLPALQSLSLGGLAITDAGLEHLVNLPHLRHLNLGCQGIRPSQITADATKRLFDSIPTLESIITTNNQFLNRDRTVTRRALGQR